MTLVERIAEVTSTLQAQTQRQLLDYAEYLLLKEQRELEADMDAVIAANLPALKELAK